MALRSYHSSALLGASLRLPQAIALSSALTRIYHLTVAYISLAPCAISSSPSPQACDSQKADFSSQYRLITVD
jgi:hypothetical protein